MHVHPMTSGTAVHFLSNKMGTLAQFSEVCFSVKSCTEKEVQKEFSYSAKCILLRDACIKLFARHC